jgi:hypothetical protein
MLTDHDIRDLCRRVAQAQDQTEFETALLDLRITLGEHFGSMGTSRSSHAVTVPKTKSPD